MSYKRRCKKHMPAKRVRSSREVHLTWNQGLQLVTEVEPVDYFVDVIRLRVITDRNDLVLKFASRDHVLLLLDAVLALFDGIDRLPDSTTATFSRTFKLG